MKMILKAQLIWKAFIKLKVKQNKKKNSKQAIQLKKRKNKI